MSIRLSSAQVTRIREALDLHLKIGWLEDKTRHWNIEDLVEDILKEVVPECNPSEHLIQKEQRSVSI